MFPVTIVIIALHIIFAFRLVFFNNQKVENNATEPTLPQIFLAGIGIVVLSLGRSWISLVIAFVAWMIVKFYNKPKKTGSSE